MRPAEIMETPHSAPPTHLLMLTAYLDETGQATRDYVVLAGFLGTKAQWDAFIPEWNAARAPKQFLHMCELRWKNEKTQRLLARLGPVPYNHGLIPLVGAVRVSDYVDLLDNPVEEIMMGGYQCALYPIIVQVLRSVIGTDRIKWVFEQQRVHEHAVRTVFEQFTLLDCQQRLAGVEFIGSEVLTEPADYLAYAIAHALEDQQSQKAKWCSPIAPSRMCLGQIMDRDTIRNIITFTRDAARMQTTLETGKNADEIVAPYGNKKEVRYKMETVRRDHVASPTPPSTRQRLLSIRRLFEYELALLRWSAPYTRSHICRPHSGAGSQVCPSSPAQ